MVAIEPRLSGFALVTMVGILLCTLFILGLIDYKVGISLAAVAFAVAWVVLCVSRPLLAFTILFFVFVLAHARLGIPLISLQGPGNRGVVALGDLLWLGMLLTWVIRRFFFGKPIRIRKTYHVTVWAMLPFVFMATILPAIGVLGGDWPYSYAIPGFRTLQWGIFSVYAYFLVQQYNAKRVIIQVVTVMVLAAIIHMGYGLVQLGFHIGMLDRSWIFFDDIFAMLHENTWFFYPRLTGLLVNPNSYGLYSAFVFLLTLAIYLARAHTRQRVFWRVAFGVALFGLLFSGSRSAYLGVIVAFFIWFLMGWFSRRLAARGLILSIKLLIFGALSLFSLWPVLPEVLKGRLTRFLDVFLQGVRMDANAQVRVEEWKRLWELYVTDYPFGTWVPTSYATGSAVDSYFVVTAIQGTPVFTLVWLAFLGAVVYLGWSVYYKARSRLEIAIGLALAGFVGIMSGGGLTLSPMSQPQLVVPFWVLIGVCLAIVWEEKRCGDIQNPHRKKDHSLSVDEKTS